MDIENRAAQWARDHVKELNISLHPVFRDIMKNLEEMLAAAYLAGSAQTQRDYAAHISALCDRHCL